MRPVAFFEMLRVFGVRKVVDVRLSAVFGRRMFHHGETLRVFRELNIDYIEAPELGNPFHVDPNRMDVAYREHRAHLEDYAEALAWLREQIRQGPLVLIGCDAEYVHSDQHAVLDALMCISPGFDIRILCPDDFCREGASARFQEMGLHTPPPSPPPSPSPQKPKNQKAKRSSKTAPPTGQTKLFRDI